ncbi:FHA domain-containing protein [Leptolyngbya sp. FACHB-36]|uniref:FHA domain-containing protein n=1 Tax=Leptolyngbya sp. FACHB-36 TaxID=2692808 RepID=UPI001680BA3A|nr:FHA domain-containing protein [Leptolyngbya sp. FACHB-36]MBD2021465.1 FHA domain-containing protein [Leptolyngbya sp. FACHB-36]
MIVCPNCNHQNPDGAVQCESCYTPLPATAACPNCGSTIQTDASFCGQCGSNLRTSNVAVEAAAPPAVAIPASPDIPALIPPDPLVLPEPLMANPAAASENAVPFPDSVPPPVPAPSIVPEPPSSIGTPPPPPPPATGNSRTQLQQQAAQLLHVQTDTIVELPQTLSVIHIGKPNDRIPPDVDVSGYPNSEIVSRIHADIRIEGDAFYIEDVGSSNGTYINNSPLPMGNRHRLRSGDRISLGKGDKVTFLFQLS